MRISACFGTVPKIASRGAVPTARITRIERGAIHDGPGVRYGGAARGNPQPAPEAQRTEMPQPFALPGAVFERLRIPTETQQTANPQKGAANVLNALANGKPAIVWVDVMSLPYRSATPGQGYWLVMPLLVYGYDLDADQVLIADRAQVPLHATIAEFTTARERLSDGAVQVVFELIDLVVTARLSANGRDTNGGAPFDRHGHAAFRSVHLTERVLDPDEGAAGGLYRAFGSFSELLQKPAARGFGVCLVNNAPNVVEGCTEW